MTTRKSHILTSILLLTSFIGSSLYAQFEPLPEEVQRAFFQGKKHVLKGDLDEAYASFQNCAEAEPKVGAFHYEMGKIEYELGRFESAVNHLNEAIDLEPQNDWYHYYRGVSNVALELYDDGWADLMAWVMERPGDIEALDLCAELFVNAGEYWHAYNAYSFYEDEIAKDLEVRVKRLFLILAVSNDKRSTLNFINDAIKDFPEEPLFVFEKGSQFAVDGNLEKALFIYEGLAKSHPDFLDTYLALAKCHLSLEDGVDVSPMLIKAFKSEDIDPAEKLNILYYCETEEEIDELLDLALNAHPEDVRLHHFKGMRDVQFARFEDAVKSYETALEIKVGSLEIRDEYLYLLYHLKDWEKLVEEAEKAVVMFPLEPLFNQYKGIGYEELGDHKNAAKAFKAGLAVIYDMPELGSSLASSLAMSYRELGEYEKSYDAYEESLAYMPDPYVMNNYAFFLATDRKMLNRALELSTEANVTILNEPNFLDTQALILNLLDRNDEALELIQKAQELIAQKGIADAVYLEREGDILWDLERFEEARVKWSEAVEAGGGKKRLNEKLNREVE